MPKPLSKATRVSSAKSSSSLKLSLKSLDWAKKHVEKDGDTDLLPLPFEFGLIKNNWKQIRQYLADRDLKDWNWSPGRRLLVPKDALSFRAATQLEPFDTLLATALIYSHGRKIESRRLPADTVFSHRFNPDPDGSMYDPQIGWTQFWEQCRDRASTHSHVAIVDIADCYNQIYHHPLENQLAETGLDRLVVKAIYRLLSTQTDTVSKGVMVGPAFTHILAEIALHPLDESLSASGLSFCRYIDDIHIFCTSYESAATAIQLVAAAADSQHHFTIARHKTRIVESEEYINEADHMMEDRPLNDYEKEILEIIDEYAEDGPYDSFDYEDISPDDADIFDEDQLRALFELYLKEDNPDWTRIRWLLRRLGQGGVPEAINSVMERLREMIPAIGDAARYLMRAAPNFEGDLSKDGANLIRTLKSEFVRSSEYLQSIILDIFSRHPELNHVNEITAMYSTSTSLVKRQIMLCAFGAHSSAWLKERKPELGLTCSPFPEPGGMRVSTARRGRGESRCQRRDESVTVRRRSCGSCGMRTRC